MQTSAKETMTDSQRSIVRSKVYATLANRVKRGEDGPFSAVDLFREICDELADVEVLPPGPGGSRYSNLSPLDRKHFPDFHVPSEIARFVRQQLWELYLQGILAPAPRNVCPVYGDLRPPYSYLHLGCGVLTPYGADILKDTTKRIQVHDPDGYLANFRDATPEPDPEMMRYLEECASVFRGSHFLATIVLLGIASERLIEVLAESLRDALGEPTGTKWFEKKYSKKRYISARFKELSKELVQAYDEDLKSEKLKDPFQSVVTCTFEQIRVARNDIAHPRGREFTWNEVGGLLHQFVQHFIYVNQIIALLRSKSTSSQTI